LIYGKKEESTEAQSKRGEEVEIRIQTRENRLIKDSEVRK